MKAKLPKLTGPTKYLGRFQRESILRAGHNTGPKYTDDPNLRAKHMEEEDMKRRMLSPDMGVYRMPMKPGPMRKEQPAEGMEHEPRPVDKKRRVVT